MIDPVLAAENLVEDVGALLQTRDASEGVAASSSAGRRLHGALTMATDTTEWHKSACILCECNCGIDIRLANRQFRRILTTRNTVLSRYTCEKPCGSTTTRRPASLTSALRRTAPGTYEEIDLETAISEIAQRLSVIRDTHGGDKIFFYGGGGQGNHLGAIYGRALQAALGVKYTSNALAQEKTGEMWVDGRLYGGHTKGDFENAEVVVFVGKTSGSRTVSRERVRPSVRSPVTRPAR